MICSGDLYVRRPSDHVADDDPGTGPNVQHSGHTGYQYPPIGKSAVISGAVALVWAGHKDDFLFSPEEVNRDSSLLLSNSLPLLVLTFSIRLDP